MANVVDGGHKSRKPIIGMLIRCTTPICTTDCHRDQLQVRVSQQFVARRIQRSRITFTSVRVAMEAATTLLLSRLTSIWRMAAKSFVWLWFALGCFLSGCAITPHELTPRIALLAPFEGRYREVGYNAYYAVRLAFVDAN